MPAKVITSILLHLKLTPKKWIRLSGFYKTFPPLPPVLLHILCRRTLFSCWTSHPSRQNQEFLFIQFVMLCIYGPFYWVIKYLEKTGDHFQSLSTSRKSNWIKNSSIYCPGSLSNICKKRSRKFEMLSDSGPRASQGGTASIQLLKQETA